MQSEFYCYSIPVGQASGIKDRGPPTLSDPTLAQVKMNLAFENHPKIKLRLHIIIGVLLCLNFVLIIARIADKGTPKTRSNTWGIAVVSEPSCPPWLDRGPEQLAAA